MTEDGEEDNNMWLKRRKRMVITMTMTGIRLSMRLRKIKRRTRWR